MGNEIMNKYVIVEKDTETQVAEGFASRAAARKAKKEWELHKQQQTGSTNRPSAYFVETGPDHPDGAGIYLH